MILMSARELAGPMSSCGQINMPQRNISQTGCHGGEPFARQFVLLWSVDAGTGTSLERYSMSNRSDHLAKLDFSVLPADELASSSSSSSVGLY